VPPRPHPIVLIALAIACFVIAFLIAPRRASPSEGPMRPQPRPAPRLARAAPPGAGRAAARAALPAPPHATWRWPLHGRVVGAFRLTPRAPFARGQRRGIDVAAPAGTPVHAACAGQATFAGALPHQGLALTVRCGPLVATYLRLGRLAVRRGAHVATGQRLGVLGPAGRLRLGARRAGDRRAYVDPLALLRDPKPTAPPVLGPGPSPGRRAPVPLAGVRPRPRPRPFPASQPTSAKPRGMPWPAYPALALIATALPVGGLVHRRRRHRTTTAAAPVHGAP
jgi:hypothetical protein